MKKSDKIAITAERLLELGGSLEGIIKELSEALDAPIPNPKTRVNQKQQRVAHYLNLLDNRAAKRKAI